MGDPAKGGALRPDTGEAAALREIADEAVRNLWGAGDGGGEIMEGRLGGEKSGREDEKAAMATLYHAHVVAEAHDALFRGVSLENA